MIERYKREEAGKIWEDENRFSIWLDVELAVVEGLAKEGIVPKSDFEKIKKNAKFNIKRIHEIEAKTKHDTAAFVDNISENLGEEGRWIHYGLTSSDVLDTAFAIQLKQAGKIVMDGIDSLLEVIRTQAKKHKKTLQIGRTHGMVGEPITFGHKLAIWYDEMARHKERFELACKHIACGKLSGAMGNYAHLPPTVESYALKKLGLAGAKAANQVIQRDRHAFYFSVLAGIATSLEKFAVELRHLQRSEVAEVVEGFSKGQKGSSAMPHKKNPISAENISGLARVIRSNSIAALENVPLWHERDISHSSVERIIGPDTTILSDYILWRFTDLLKNLYVDEAAMERNILQTKKLFFSQKLLLALVKKGFVRDDAYKIVQGISQSVDDKKDFAALAMEDKNVKKEFDSKELKVLFSMDSYTKNIDHIFSEVFK